MPEPRNHDEGNTPLENLDPVLGPFYLLDEATGERIEFIPLGYEKSAMRLVQALGDFTVRSNLLELDGAQVRIDDALLTAFIQADWDRAVAGNSARGFLLASRGANAAAGRVAEEVVLRQLLSRATLFGSPVKELLDFWAACDRGLVARVQVGEGSDDLILLLEDGRLAALESKAMFRTTGYLLTVRPKIAAQLQATLAANPTIGLVLAALVDLVNHTVVVCGTEREPFLTNGLDWSWV